MRLAAPKPERGEFDEGETAALDGRLFGASRLTHEACSTYAALSLEESDVGQYERDMLDPFYRDGSDALARVLDARKLEPKTRAMRGHIVEIGTKRSLFSSPRHPYMQALLSAVLVADPGARGKIDLLSGETPSPVNLPPIFQFVSRCPRRNRPVSVRGAAPGRRGAPTRGRVLPRRGDGR